MIDATMLLYSAYIYRGGNARVFNKRVDTMQSNKSKKAKGS